MTGSLGFFLIADSEAIRVPSANFECKSMAIVQNSTEIFCQASSQRYCVQVKKHL